MPKVPIDTAPAGPALDAAVAEVRGERDRLTWICVVNGHWIDGDIETGWCRDCQALVSDSEQVFAPKKPVSTEDAAAWKLIDELHDQSVFMCLSYENDLCEWYCGLTNAIDDRTIDFEIGADTRPLAITRAYLKAKGIEEVEVD